MQSGKRSAPVRYRYRPSSEEEEPARAEEAAGSDASEAELEAAAASTSAATAASRDAAPAASSKQSWLDRPWDAVGDLSLSGKQLLGIGAAIASLALGLVLAIRRGGSDTQPQQEPRPRKRGVGSKAGGSKQKGPLQPGPNAKVKPSPTCVPLADGSAVVVRRPIAADNSCLFNSVGYLMHHSKNRAPYLRNVVAREVSSDPERWYDDFLGMPNARYCNWIVQPHTWGGGIELAILAAHYRREIAAWDLASGEHYCFGEESGYSKQVMVIYSGTHYDALVVAASPKADPEEDVTEFNPRTKRGRMVLAAAAQLVKLTRRNAPSHKELQRSRAEAAEAAADKAAAAAGAEPPAGPEQQGGPTTAAAAGPAGAQQQLRCGSCSVVVAGMEGARAHAAASGHDSFEEV